MQKTILSSHLFEEKNLQPTIIMNAGLIKRREERKRRRILYVQKASFRNLIRKMLSRFQDGLSISEAATDIIDSIIFDLFHELAAEAKELMVYSGKRTLTAHDIQYAAKRYFKGEIARHAISEGNKAVQAYLDVSRR